MRDRKGSSFLEYCLRRCCAFICLVAWLSVARAGVHQFHVTILGLLIRWDLLSSDGFIRGADN